MKPTINDQALDQLFRVARSQNGWKDEPISDTLMYAVYDLMRWGPTSANCSPARFIFVKSDEAKQRLKPYLAENNEDKVLTAPMCAIIGHDLEFYEKMPQLFPHNPEAKDWFSGDPVTAEVIAMRNGTLQGAYFMIAARALGLDCGPMSGFDNDGVDKEFFPDGKVKSNFICSIGVGEPSKVFERLPRLSFEEACEVL
jgi:3-hydroxypropanoate dehydrogenase